MKIITFAEMLKLPAGIIFCQVDVADNIKMGGLCCKRDNRTETSFRYTLVGGEILVNSYDEIPDLADEIYDQLKVTGVVENLGLDLHDSRTEEENVLISYAVYDRSELDRLIGFLSASTALVD
jgi:hypothetical protein